MKVIGLDLSLTNTGFAYITQDSYTTYSIKSKLKGVARLNEIYNEVKSKLRDCDLVVIEGYGFGSQKAHSLGELGGLIKFLLYNEKYKVMIVPPTVLKKFLTGKGNSDKSIMMMTTYKKYGVEITDDNQVDAYVLAKLGQMYFKKNKTLKEKEILSKVTFLQ